MGKIKTIYFDMLEKHGEDVILDPERALEEYNKEQATIQAELASEREFQANVDRLYSEKD